MIADLNVQGPAQVRYIHWRASQDFDVAQVMCYSKKRLYRDQLIDESPPMVPWLLPMNAPIQDGTCSYSYTKVFRFTDGTNEISLKIWRSILINDRGDFDGYHMVEADGRGH